MIKQPVAICPANLRTQFVLTDLVLLEIFPVSSRYHHRSSERHWPDGPVGSRAKKLKPCSWTLASGFFYIPHAPTHLEGKENSIGRQFDHLAGTGHISAINRFSSRNARCISHRICSKNILMSVVIICYTSLERISESCSRQAHFSSPVILPEVK